MAPPVRVPARTARVDVGPAPSTTATVSVGSRPSAAITRMQRAAGNQAVQRLARMSNGAGAARASANGTLTAAGPERPTGAESGDARLNAPAPEALEAERRAPKDTGAAAADPALAARAGQLDAVPALGDMAARAAETPPDVPEPDTEPVRPALAVTSDPAALQAQTSRAIGQISTPTLGNFTGAYAAIRAQGFRSAATSAAGRSPVSRGPKRGGGGAMLSDPIRPSEPDPSPQSTKELRKKSNRPLDKVEALPIEKELSPGQHVPNLTLVSAPDFRPVSSEDFHALLAISASDKVLASLKPEERALLEKDLERLTELRKQLSATPVPDPNAKAKTKEEKKKEEEQRVVQDFGPPPPLTFAEEDKGKLATVFARLLAETDVTAEAIMHKVRQNVPLIGFGLDQKFPNLGNAEHKGQIKSEVEKRIEQLRDGAGITKEELDKKIAERRAELERLRAQAAAGTQAAAATAVQAVSAEGQKTADATAGVSKGAEKKAEAVKKTAEKAKLPMDVESRRTRLLADTTRVVTEQTTAYKQRLEMHRLRIDGLARRMAQAYKFAAQQDELQITTKAGKDAASAAVAEETKKVRDWLGQKEAGTKAFAEDKKKAADTQSKTFQDELHAAGDARREALRAWADKKLGTSRTVQEKDKQRAIDAADQQKAEVAAWEKVQNSRAVQGMLGQHGDFALVKDVAKAVQEGQDRNAIIENQKLGADQIAVLDAYLGVLDPKDASAIVMKGEDKEANGVTAGMLVRLGQTLGTDIAPKMEGYLLAQHGEEWRPLNELGGLQKGGFEATQVGNRVRDAVDRIGTEEDWIFTALDGLTKIQIQAVRGYYLERFKTTIDADLEDDLSGRELERAQALLEGNTAKADAYGLRQAMKGNWEGALGGLGDISGAGTDEDAMHKILRDRPPAERAAIIRAYNEMFDPALKGLMDKAKTQDERDRIYAKYAADHPSKLLEDAKDELGEGRDGERFEAEAAGNDDLADAIELRDVLPTPEMANNPEYPAMADHEKVTAIYDRIRREVTAQGTKGDWTQAQIEGEIARRAKAVEKYFDTKYAKDYHAGETGALRAAFDVGFQLAPEQKNLAYALADNDVAKADAARVRIEHKGVYADDDILNEIVQKQYERALEATRRDEMPLRRMLMARQLTDLERKDPKRPWTGAKLWEERERLQRQLDRTMEEGAKAQAKGNLQGLRDAYRRDYGGDLDADIKSGTSGYDHEKAKKLLEQDGYLTPAQTIFYAIRGTGTDEDALKRALQGRTAAEIEAMRKEFKELARKDNSTALGIFNSLLDDPYADRTDMDAQIADDLSGRMQFDIGQLLKGTPETIDQKRERLLEALNYERDVGPMGSALAGDAVTAMDADLAYLDETIKKLNDPTLTPDQRELYLGFFEQNVQTVEEGIQQHRRELDTWVDRITTAIGMVIALATIAIVSFFTLGAGGVVLVSLLGSILATASTMAVKGAILGGQYGWEDIGTDIAIGIADALLAAVTAGMGEKLMGLAKAGTTVAGEAAEQGAKKMLFQQLRSRGANFFKTGAGRLVNPTEGALARMVPTSTALKEMVEKGGFSKLLAVTLAEGSENLAASSGSALMSTALNEQTWEQGNPLKNLALGTLQQSATSAAIGLGVSSMHKIGSSALGRARSGIEMLRDPATVANVEWRTFNRQFPDVSHAEFIQAKEAARLELEVRRAAEGAPAEGGAREAGGTTERADLGGGRAPEAARAPGDTPPTRPLTEGDMRENLPADLRERIPVSIDSTLKGRTVKVEFTRSLGGLTDIRIVAGPNARPIDIMLHAPTVHAMQRYTGLGGRVVALIERMRFWFVKNGVPPVGTRAWEAYFELNKLPLILEARLQALRAGGLDVQARGEILADIDHLSRQIDLHTATLNRLDLSPGEGYVAATGVHDTRIPAPVHENARPGRGDLDLPRYPVDDSPLKTPHEVRQVGPPWLEDGRTYRLIEVVNDKGERVALREEIELQTNGKNNGQWHRRGSDAVRGGEAAELAAYWQALMETVTDPRKLRDVVLDPSVTKRGSNQGFDLVLLRFGEDGRAKVILVEVKDYPDRYVPKSEFTAIADNLTDNIRHLFGVLSDPAKVARLGLSEVQARAARLAIGELDLEIEIRLTEKTKLGTEDTGTVVKDIRTGAKKSLQKEIKAKLGKEIPVRQSRPADPNAPPELGYIDANVLARADQQINALDVIGATPRFHALATQGSALTDTGVKQAQVALTLEGTAPHLLDKPLRRAQGSDMFVDAKGNRYVIVSPDPGMKAGPLAQRLVASVHATATSVPGEGPRPPRILLDVTEMSPQQRGALRKELAQLKAKNPALDLSRIMLVDARRQTVTPLSP
jgi:hypothetical protein